MQTWEIVTRPLPDPCAPRQSTALRIRLAFGTRTARVVSMILQGLGIGDCPLVPTLSFHSFRSTLIEYDDSALSHLPNFKVGGSWDLSPRARGPHPLPFPSGCATRLRPCALFLANINPWSSASIGLVNDP